MAKVDAKRAQEVLEGNGWRVLGALEVLKAGMDRILMVDDKAVKEAMRAYFVDTHNVAEGAGAIGLAALLMDCPKGGKKVGTVLCGGNVDSDVFGSVLCDAGMI